MRVTKKLAAVMIAFATVIAVAGTSIPVEAAAKAPKKITLKTTTKIVDIKGQTTVSVKSVSPKGADTGVKYSSNNKKVATVSSKGVVTGKKAGKATITATSKKNKKVKAKITVTVKQLKPTSISLASSASLKVGGKKALKATVKPAGVYCPVTWKSSDASVATVDSKGNVTAKKAGTAVITVTAKEKNKSGKYLSKKCTVTVAGDTAKPEPTPTPDEIEWQYVTSEKLLANKADYIIIDLRPNVIESDGKDNGNGYKYGHIEGSVHVPAWPVDTKEKEDMLRNPYVLEQLKNSDKKIAFICQSGKGGAKNAITVLSGEGITVSRMYIQEGGGIDLIKRFSSQLVKGEGEQFSNDLVINASEVQARVAAGAILVDTRNADEAAKETAKGAINVMWQKISKTTMTDGTASGQKDFARPLDKEAMSKALSEFGLGLDDDIILFSKDYESTGWGDDGRIAWQLLQCGYKNVHIVNGGLPAMKAAGIATQKGASALQPKDVTIADIDTKSHDITTEELLANFSDYKIIDVRTNDEYNGATEWGETSGGHIKGAIHIRFTDMFRYDGTLKSNAELTKMFESYGLKKSDKIVTYCTGGIRSAYMQLILQMLGYENSYNYAESAYRWSNTTDAGTADCWEGPVTTVAFGKSEITTGTDGYRLSAKGAIAEANPLVKTPVGAKITYSTSDANVAKVDSTGTVTTTATDGEATITATASNGSKASYKVIITDRVKDSIDWDKQTIDSKTVIDGAKDGSWIVLDTRPDTIPQDDPAIPDVGYAVGHIKGSIHVDSWPVETKAAEDALRGTVEELKKTDKSIAIICRTGKGGAKRAISVLKDEGIDVSRMFIQSGGGTDLIKNHFSELETNQTVSTQSTEDAEEVTNDTNAADPEEAPAETPEATEADTTASAEEAPEETPEAETETPEINEPAPAEDIAE